MISAYLIVAAACLIGLAIVAFAVLTGWRGWLDLKRDELMQQPRPIVDRGSPAGIARIELSDLKERIRKLEAIAAGVDL